jgi:hypothetical protein
VRFGEQSVLPTDDSNNGNLLVAQSAVLPTAGTTQSLSFYATRAAGTLRLGIYDSSGPGGGPGKLLASTASFTPVAGWNTQPTTSQPNLPAGTYWLAYLPSSSDLAFRMDDGASSSGRYYSFTYGPLPTTFDSAPNTTPFHWSFYATVLSSGAG